MFEYLIPALFMTVAFLLFRQAKKEKQKGNHYAMAAFISIGVILIAGIILNAWLSAKISFFFGSNKTPITKEVDDLKTSAESSNDLKIIEYPKEDVSTEKITIQTLVNNFQRVSNGFGNRYFGQWAELDDRHAQLNISSNAVLILPYEKEGDYSVTGAVIIYENSQNQAILNDIQIVLCSLFVFFEPSLTHDKTLLIANEFLSYPGDVNMILGTGNAYFLTKQKEITQITVVLNLPD
jgi:hypothetical protein